MMPLCLLTLLFKSCVGLSSQRPVAANNSMAVPVLLLDGCCAVFRDMEACCTYSEPAMFHVLRLLLCVCHGLWAEAVRFWVRCRPVGDVSSGCMCGVSGIV